MFICGQEFSPEIIMRIQDTVEMEADISRRTLSRRVCEWLDWRNDTGAVKEMSCRKALKALESKRILSLPPARSGWKFEKGGGRASSEPVTPPILKCSLNEIGPVEIIRVRSRYSRGSRVWNGLMDSYHYLGRGPLCGAQARYLIRSLEHGWLGGLSFSGAAWCVSARDRFIGWSESARRNNLRYLVCNSRFLIAPSVEVPNLASYVLSQCLKRLRSDWKNRYGYEPFGVETFVDKQRFKGTCYRAANWSYLGDTIGRGRNHSAENSEVTVKGIFLYGFGKCWRERLCEEPEQPLPAIRRRIAVTKPPRIPKDWADAEMGEASFSDSRLSDRLVELTRSFFGQPGANIPQACGSRTKSKAAYRFFDNSRVSMDKILESHYLATANRAREHKIVLVPQDTSSLNYENHFATEGLGPINTSKHKAIGLELHDTLAFTTEGTPLGLVNIQCWARDGDAVGTRNIRTLPIEEKESFKWLASYRAIAEFAKKCPGTKFVSISDRESDIHELFAESLSHENGPELIVRSERSRKRKVEDGKLWEVLEKKQLDGLLTLKIPRRGKRKAREATLEVRYRSVFLQPPGKKKRLGQVPAQAVYIREINAPEDVKEPIEWLLVTTLPVDDLRQACQIVEWYAARWNIEIYHRVLKSGCRIEDRQLGHTDRIQSCLAIDLVVAWRIYFLTKQGRETPDLPCTVFFEDDEWKALACFVNNNPEPSEEPPTLREAVRMVASLGGFLGRKSDGEPGPTTVWRGLQRLDDIVAMWRIFTRQRVCQTPTVPKKLDYG